MSSHYAGWALPKSMQETLLRMAPAMHPIVRCDHITFCTVRSDSPPPPPAIGIVRGMYYDEFCQALIVQMNDMTVRSDGKLFHITMSKVATFPSAMVGDRMAMFPEDCTAITPYPLGTLGGFVRKIA